MVGLTHGTYKTATNTSIKRVGSNITTSSLQQAARSVVALNNVVEGYMKIATRRKAVAIMEARIQKRLYKLL